MEEGFGKYPGDKKIEVSLDHRTLIIVKNPNHPTVMEIYIAGSPNNSNDVVLVDIQPGEGNAIDVYHIEPKEEVHIRSLPISDFEKRTR